LGCYLREGIARLPEMTIAPVVYRSGHQNRATTLLAEEWAYEAGPAEMLEAYLKGLRNLYIDRLCSILEAESTLPDGKGKLAVCESVTCKRFFRMFIRAKRGQLYCSDGCRTREAARKKRRRERQHRRLMQLGQRRRGS
jgi:hypothetical protein